MLNKLRDEIHENSIAHGWWEEDRPFAEVIALCHSELSEALEEYRNDRPMIYYYKTEDVILRDRLVPWLDIENANGRKLEGIAVELADTIIRILDYCGKENIDIEEILSERRAGNDTYTLPVLIAECHYQLAEAYKVITKMDKHLHLAECINLIQYWCSENGINIEETIRIKHEYNKNRPYRHGGKKI